MNLEQIETIADGIVDKLEALEEHEAAAQKFQDTREALNLAEVGTFWKAADRVMKYDGWRCDASDGHTRTYTHTDLSIRVGWRRDVPGSRWHKFDRISYTTTIDFEPRPQNIAAEITALPTFEAANLAYQRRALNLTRHSDGYDIGLFWNEAHQHLVDQGWGAVGHRGRITEFSKTGSSVRVGWSGSGEFSVTDRRPEDNYQERLDDMAMQARWAEDALNEQIREANET